jgi:hypothetical protein
VFNFPYLTLSPEGLNAAEFMRNHSIYRVSAADGSSEDVGGHATGFRFEGEWLARYNGRNGLNLSAGNILLVPRYVPVLEAGYVQREEFGREQTLFDQLENQRIAAANARYFQQQAEMAADLAVAGLPDMPAGYFEMLQQMPPDQMQRIIASPSFGGTVAVTDSRRIEGVAFARQATYLLGSDTEIDAAISANPHAEVIFVHPESRSTAEMSRVNGLDNVATLEQFAAIRALNGAPLQGGQLWKEFLDYRGMKSDEIDREYALIDGYATLATTGSQLILGTGAGLMAPVPYLASIFAGMGTDYAVTKITGNADAGLIAGMAAGFLAGGLMARAMPADTLVGRGLQLWQPGGTEGRLSIAYKPGLPGHNKVGIQMKGGNGTQWADLIYSEEFKELSANGAFQAAQLAAGGQPAHINLATGISPKYQITTVPVTRTQGEAVLQYFLDKASNPGTYSMVGNSCSSFCVGALDAAGVQSPRWTPTPGLLFNWAKGM